MVMVTAVDAKDVTVEKIAAWEPEKLKSFFV